MFFQCPHHHAIQTSTNAGWALNFTSITSKQIDQWVQMSLPHLPQTHTHNWGSKQSHMHDPTIFQNKAYRCQTRGPKALAMLYGVIIIIYLAGKVFKIRAWISQQIGEFFQPNLSLWGWKIPNPITCVELNPELSLVI